MVFKHTKQHFADEDSYQFSYNLPRQLDCGGQLASFVELSSSEDFSVEVREGISSPPFLGKLRRGGDAIIPNNDASCALAIDFASSWSLHRKRASSEDKPDEVASKRTRQLDSSLYFANSSVTSEGPPSSVEEGTRLESPVQLSFFPGYFEEGHRTAGFIQPEETHSPVFDHPPQKHVPLGPNHQANVPVLRSHGLKSSLGELGDCDKWISSCVIPMHSSDLLGLDSGLGNITPDCRCPDAGSTRCGRQHVLEARENLEKRLGRKIFLELGFHDMGEVVAERWPEEEQQFFHEVVASNPASLGRNFWDVLPRVFPSRSRKELVSYYFNVFMLRKRAGQNRVDPMNPDSDDDEWQESDEEDEEDSVVDSPTDVSQAEILINQEAEDQDDSCDDEEPYGNESKDGVEGHYVEDDSCTSYEGQHGIVHPCDSSTVFDIAHHEYLGGECDPKACGMSYIREMENDVDFLPTCSVIEEFGKGSWKD